MRNRILALISCAAAFVALPLGAQPSGGTKPDVLTGPATAKLGGTAHVQLPTGYMFLDGATTRAMMKAAGEPKSGNEVGFIRPTNGHWSVFFEFSDVGYVKDDEKDKLDAQKMLKDITAGNDLANKERQRAGNPPLIIVGWEQEPKYNPETHNLEWAIRATSEGQPVLNYNTRLLGRKGVMEVVLVCDPEDLAKTLPPFKELMAGYNFGSGQTYAEYKPGDKVAKYGLAALVVGGAAVGAVKLGWLASLAVIFKKAWKVVIVAVVAVAAAVKKFFGRLFGGRGSSETM